MNWNLVTMIIGLFSAVVTGLGDEIKVISTSGGFDPDPIPVMAFFESDLKIHFSIDRTLDSLKGSDVYYALFQRIGKRVIPLGETVLGGTVEETEFGTLASSLIVKVPNLNGRAQLSVKAQIDGTKIGKVINFTALSDDILAQLAEKNIRTTNAEGVRKAFTDRNLEAPEHPLDELRQGGDWAGLWFVALRGDERASMVIPAQLQADQILILLEVDDEEFPFPIAVQRGAGWVVHFNQSWFEGFSTNAGTQSAFLNTVKRISTK